MIAGERGRPDPGGLDRRRCGRGLRCLFDVDPWQPRLPGELGALVIELLAVVTLPLGLVVIRPLGPAIAVAIVPALEDLGARSIDRFAGRALVAGRPTMGQRRLHRQTRRHGKLVGFHDGSGERHRHDLGVASVTLMLALVLPLA